MSWKEINVIDQRKLFIQEHLENKENIAQLCRQFDISRPTGYKWIERYKNEGFKGLEDKSRAPYIQKDATPTEVVNAILEIKYKYPTWGPKKIKGYLELEFPHKNWPSKTTIENFLKKNGLTIPRKLRKRLAQKTQPLADCNESNNTWCLDFKGWFMTRDNLKCEPFTLMDAHSRYLFCCCNLDANKTDYVWGVLDRMFREYGLPQYMRSDNGPPFATRGAGRLSRLSVRLIKAGITPEFIDPGKPCQNGRHERMHLTVKQDSISNTLNLEEQQIKFSDFIEYYNFIRPHESLGQKRPGDIYQPSPRIWNGRLKSPEYSDEYMTVKVHSCGKANWKGKVLYISRVLDREPVGIKENAKGKLEVFYGPIFLGELDNDKLKFKRLSGRNRKTYR